MIYQGTFKNSLDEDITVAFDVPDGDPNVESIGSSGDDIQFLKNPVRIEDELDDLFQVVEIKSCTIKLLVKPYLGGTLFARNSRDIRVTVTNSTKVLFAGYVEPNVYNQPYNREWNQISLSCSDGLSTLQYIKYNNIQTVDQYNEEKSKIDSVTLGAVISAALSGARDIDVINNAKSNIYYDGSVRLNENDAAADSIFQISVYEALFFGEEFDDLMAYDEVFENFLMYLNLHIRQEGSDYYIYHRASITEGNEITWTPILGSVGLDTQTGEEVYGAYVLVRDQYMLFNSEYREKFIHSITREVIPGNKLNEVLGPSVEYVSGEYRQYYYVVLPNRSRVKTDKYIVVDGDENFIYLDKDGNKRILLQSPKGDYDWSDLDDAPNSAYEGGSFKHDYFTVQENEFLITE